jgi:hypothetical protein
MERKPNKNEALEALDFIINVLKEHEKDLDRLISQLGIITESLGETGEITGRIESIEDSISNLQNEITNTLKNIVIPQKTSTSQTSIKSVNINCKKWEDFKNLANEAETVSYLFRISENTFQANAIKNGKLISYNGDIPPYTHFLKLWLSKELEVSEEDIVEGALNLR